MRATEALEFLQSLKTYELPAPRIEEIEELLPEATGRIGQELAGTNRMLRNQPTPFALQAGQAHWRQFQLKLSGWLKETTQWAAQLRGALHRLDDLSRMWTRTLTFSRAANALGPVVGQIESTLASIEAAQRVLKTLYDASLDLQTRIAEGKSAVTTQLRRSPKPNAGR